jgi:hypothetical protein
MQKLYIAGDSFASLSNIQSIGNSWSEILANDLGLDLINVARPAASNFSIALQIDWITDRITPDDFLIVFLTDHYRKTLVNLDTEKDDNKHLLEYHSIHDEQRPSTILQYSSEPRLISSTIHHQGRTKEYYRDWFDVEIQEIEDRLILTGVFAKLSTITDKFLVCKGGYGKEKDCTSHKTFCIKKHQFVNYTSIFMTMLSEPTLYINHLDDMTHKKLVVLLKKKLGVSMSGKGDRPRPYSVDQKTFESNWESIFGNEENKFSEFEDKITRNNSETQEVLSRDSSVGRAPG